MKILLSIVVVAASLHAEQITTEKKRFLFSDDGSEVVIHGSWRLLTKRPSVEIPAVNSVRIECSKRTGTCREFATKLIRPSDDVLKDIDHPYLWLMVENFTIQKWTAQEILAPVETRAADIFLRISLRHQTAVRESRETEVDGSKGRFGEENNR